MEVTYEAAALKGLKAMPKADAKRLRDALLQIADAHPERLSYVTEMVGQAGAWRARKGDYRAVYKIEGDRLVVIAAGNRKDIYR